MRISFKKKYGFLFVLLIILALPLVAMQFTSAVKWNFFDFLMAGLLLSLSYFVGKFIFVRVKNWPLKIAVLIVLFLILLMIWAELEVGIFDSFFAGS